jgi:hypothetical protein
LRAFFVEQRRLPVPSKTYVPVTINGDWQDLCALIAGIANTTVTVQLRGGANASVVFGSEARTAPDAGVLLVNAGDAVQGSAANIWVRGGGTIVVHQE